MSNSLIKLMIIWGPLICISDRQMRQLHRPTTPWCNHYQVTNYGDDLSYLHSNSVHRSTSIPKEKRFRYYHLLGKDTPSPDSYNAHISKIKLTRKPCLVNMRADSIFSYNKDFVLIGNSLISPHKPYNKKFSKVLPLV